MVRSKTYKTLAIIIILSILVSLWPARVWAGILNAPELIGDLAIESESDPLVADTNQVNMLETLPQDMRPEFASLNKLFANSGLEDEYIDISAFERLQQRETLSGPASLIEPLTISREQSTYSALGAINNTLIVTFTVTNNRPLSNLPDIDSHATITDTIDTISSFDFSNDPNTIYNVLLTDELLSENATLINYSRQHDNI